jgi:hypothetical protein
VAKMTPVAVLLLAWTPPISCRLSMRIRYPGSSRIVRIPITRPSWGALTNSQEQAYSPKCAEQKFCELRLYSVLGR